MAVDWFDPGERTGRLEPSPQRRGHALSGIAAQRAQCLTRTGNILSGLQPVPLALIHGCLVIHRDTYKSSRRDLAIPPCQASILPEPSVGNWCPRPRPAVSHVVPFGDMVMSADSDAACGGPERESVPDRARNGTATDRGMSCSGR